MANASDRKKRGGSKDGAKNGGMKGGRKKRTARSVSFLIRSKPSGGGKTPTATDGGGKTQGTAPRPLRPL